MTCLTKRYSPEPFIFVYFFTHHNPCQVELDPTNDFALFWSGYAIFYTDDMETAKDRFLECLRLFPQNLKV